MSEDTKKKVREECEITLPHFQVIMGKLRKNKVIVDGKINPRYIPSVNEENGSFKMMLLFDFFERISFVHFCNYLKILQKNQLILVHSSYSFLLFFCIYSKLYNISVANATN